MNFKPERMMRTAKTAKADAKRVNLIGYGVMLIVIIFALAFVVTR